MAKSRGMGCYVSQEEEWQSQEGWVAKSRGMGGSVERDGWQSRYDWWLSREGWVAKSRGIDG